MELVLSDLEPLVALPPVVDIDVQINLGRLQIGMLQLSLEVLEGYAQVEVPGPMEMPKVVRGDHVEGLAVLIAHNPLYPRLLPGLSQDRPRSPKG